MRFQLSNAEESTLKQLVVDTESMDRILHYVDNLMMDAYEAGKEEGEESGWQSAQENYDWVDDLIKEGSADEEVVSRARELGYKKPTYPNEYENYKQDQHRANHPDGPYGFEYCAKCK